MRISERKTTIAVLRSIIGIKVEPFAGLAGCSIALVQKMENGARACTDSTATKLEIATGCSRQWILDGKRTAACLAYDGRKFTAAIYDEIRAGKESGVGFAVNVCGVLPELAAVACSAADAGKLAVFAVKLKDAMRALSAEFGFSRPVFDQTLATMGNTPEHYVWDICDARIKDDQVWRIKQGVDLLKQGAVTMTTKHSASVMDGAEYFRLNPETRPGAKTKVVRRKRQATAGTLHESAELVAECSSKHRKKA